MSFQVLPPEINSVLMYGGAGPGPLLAAATAWDGLAAELGSAAASFGSVTSGLLGGSWQGASSVAMAAAAAPYAGWLSATAAQAQAAAGQARVAAAAFEAALSATVDPGLVAANRSVLRSLALSNLFGQNTAAIAAAEADYELMWAQDVVAMVGYHVEASAAASALQAFTQPWQALGALASSTKELQVNVGLGNVGNYNVGGGNVGVNNLGLANLGSQNLGAGNLGSGNFGFGNIGNGNFGFGNSGLGPIPGIGNVGLGNAGSGNYGFANLGVGNIGFGNTGNNNIGIGLTGDNLTGIGGLNSGSGNIGLFNSGTGNFGFFNSGTGNFGLFNSGSYNTGFGNSGTASTGLFNAGDFNTGVANAGGYNTGSFNVGSFNTGDFNPGNTNTGWFNTGNINTGVANSGNVNTGAFIRGNYSNGMFLVGDYQGLVGFAAGSSIPAIPIGLGLNGGVGPIALRPIPILPTVPLNIHHTFYIPPLVVPDIVIPAFGGGTPLSINVGPITLSPIKLFPGQKWGPLSLTIPAGNLGTNIGQTGIIRIPAMVTIANGATAQIIGPIDINTNFPPLTINMNWDTPAITLFPDGVTVPNAALELLAKLSVGTPGFTIPGFSIPGDPIPLTIDIVGQIDGFTTPAITIDRIPLDIGAGIKVGPIPIHGFEVPANPGFGNTTTAPSSCFQIPGWPGPQNRGSEW
ncbi:PPE family protein, partial [Mycobacterium simulans]|uniref:PPE family protein n=1 Tax=Mycobacterium simulans TaxID=627089 RepID=UPI001640956C